MRVLRRGVLRQIIAISSVGGAIAAGAAVPAAWTDPLSMHRGSIEHYFRTTFREKSYGSFCGNHMIDFLAYAAKSSQPIPFMSKIVDLFHSRMKEALWTNPYITNAVLEGLSTYGAPVCEAAAELRAGEVKEAIYDMLRNRFDELKRDPDSVLTELADEIVTITERAAIVRLRGSMVRLVENMLDRLVWLLAEQEQAWEITCKIAENLYHLYEVDIIPDSITLNQCLWSLTYRFAYSIETTGETMSIATYQRIKQDILAENSVLFSWKDELQQQSGMKSRAAWLREVLVVGEARARASDAHGWVAPFPVCGTSY